MDVFGWRFEAHHAVKLCVVRGRIVETQLDHVPVGRETGVEVAEPHERVCAVGCKTKSACVCVPHVWEVATAELDRACRVAMD